MFKPYDIAVKKLIEVFTSNIKVIGLQNDDGTDNFESVMSQAGKNNKEDKIKFPIISVFRNPEIEITDGSMTKRASTSIGYSEINWDNRISDTLVAMRTTLGYTIDVFDVTRSSAEEIAMKLYFRLRNNPEINANFIFPDLNKKYGCKAEIELNSQISNVKIQGLESPQIYKIRFSFNLVNANVYDIISKELPREIRWTITAELDKDVDFNNKI